MTPQQFVPMVEDIEDFNEEVFAPFVKMLIDKNTDKNDRVLVYVSTFDVRNSDICMSYDFGHPSETGKHVQRIFKRLRYYGARTSDRGVIKISAHNLRKIAEKFTASSVDIK